MTVPPERAEQQRDDARSFANEFAPTRGQAVAKEEGLEDARPRPVDEADAPTLPHGQKRR